MYISNRQMGQPEQTEVPDFSSGYAPYYHHKKPSGIDPVEAVRVMGQLIPGMTEIPPEGKRKLMDTLLRYGQEQKRQRKTPDYEWVPGKGAVPFESAPHDSVSPILRTLGKAGASLGASALDYMANIADFRADFSNSYDKLIDASIENEEERKKAKEAMRGISPDTYRSLAKKARNTLNDLTDNASVKIPFSYDSINKGIDSVIKNEAGRKAIKGAINTIPVTALTRLLPEEIPESMIWEAIVNFDNFAPAGIAKKGTTVARIVKSALAGGGINAALGAGHVSGRDDLTKEQKAAAIGLYALLGALFGGGASALSKGADKATAGTAEQFLKKLKGKAGVSSAESEAAAPALSAADDLFPAQPYAAPSGGKDPFPLSDYEVDPENIPFYLLKQSEKTGGGRMGAEMADDIPTPARPGRGGRSGAADDALSTMPSRHHSDPAIQWKSVGDKEFRVVSNDQKVADFFKELPEGEQLSNYAVKNAPRGKVKGEPGEVWVTDRGIKEGRSSRPTDAQSHSMALIPEIIENGKVYRAEPSLHADSIEKEVYHLITPVYLQNKRYLAFTTIKRNERNGKSWLEYYGHRLKEVDEARARVIFPIMDLHATSFVKIADWADFVKGVEPEEVAKILGRDIRYLHMGGNPMKALENLSPGARQVLIRLAGRYPAGYFHDDMSKDAERLPPPRQMMNHVQNKGTFGLEDLKALMRKKYQSENSKKMPDWIKRKLEAEKAGWNMMGID